MSSGQSAQTWRATRSSRMGTGAELILLEQAGKWLPTWTLMVVAACTAEATEASEDILQESACHARCRRGGLTDEVVSMHHQVDVLHQLHSLLAAILQRLRCELSLYETPLPAQCKAG